MMIADFAYAIDIPVNAARKWLTRAQAFTHARGESGDWASFTESDVIEGALMVAIMNTINVPVREAYEIVDRLLRRAPAGLHFYPPDTSGPKRTVRIGDPRTMFKGKFVVLLRGPVTWHIGVFPAAERLKVLEKSGRAHVVIDAHAIITAALERARLRAQIAAKSGKKAA
jgi:hypothetical protein